MARSPTLADQDATSVRAGSVTMVLGLLLLAATGFAYPLSLSDGFNPPHWVRVAGLVWLPLGLVGTPSAHRLARTGPGRRRGRFGLGAALAGVAAFVVLLVDAG